MFSPNTKLSNTFQPIQNSPFQEKTFQPIQKSLFQDNSLQCPSHPLHEHAEFFF